MIVEQNADREAMRTRSRPLTDRDGGPI